MQPPRENEDVLTATKTNLPAKSLSNGNAPLAKTERKKLLSPHTKTRTEPLTVDTVFAKFNMRRKELDDSSDEEGRIPFSVMPSKSFTSKFAPSSEKKISVRTRPHSSNGSRKTPLFEVRKRKQSPGDKASRIPVLQDKEKKEIKEVKEDEIKETEVYEAIEKITAIVEEFKVLHDEIKRSTMLCRDRDYLHELMYRFFNRLKCIDGSSPTVKQKKDEAHCFVENAISQLEENISTMPDHLETDNEELGGDFSYNSEFSTNVFDNSSRLTNFMDKLPVTINKIQDKLKVYCRMKMSNTSNEDICLADSLLIIDENDEKEGKSFIDTSTNSRLKRVVGPYFLVKNQPNLEEDSKTVHVETQSMNGISSASNTSIGTDAETAEHDPTKEGHHYVLDRQFLQAGVRLLIIVFITIVIELPAFLLVYSLLS